MLHAQRNHYFVKMAPLQKDSRFSATGKTIGSQTKHVVMNVWNYFDQETKKGRCSSDNLIAQKVVKATGRYTCAVAPRFYPLL